MRNNWFVDELSIHVASAPWGDNNTDLDPAFWPNNNKFSFVQPKSDWETGIALPPIPGTIRIGVHAEIRKVSVFGQTVASTEVFASEFKAPGTNAGYINFEYDLNTCCTL